MKRVIFTILFVSLFAFCFVQNATAQVSNVKAAWQSDGSVLITWSYSGSTTTKIGTPLPITIASSLSSSGPFANMGQVNAAASGNYKATNVNKLVSTYFRVSSGSETTPQGASVGPYTPPADPAPIGLKATAGDGQVALSWNAVSGLGITYNVKSSTSIAGPFTAIKTGLTTTNFTVTGLPNGTAKYFVVSTSTLNREGPNSASVSATPVAPAAPIAKLTTAPSGLTGRGISADTISLSWTALAGADTYTVKMGTVSGGPYNIVKSGLTTRSFQATGLTRATLYYFVVSASNSQGESPNSPQVAIKTPSFIQ